MTQSSTSADAVDISSFEAFYGSLVTLRDALLVIEAVRRGLLPRVVKRLDDTQREAIRPGSVFVWLESETGMKRWTDGKCWSPSRILGSFLTYREVRKALRHKVLPKDIDVPPDGLIKKAISVTAQTGERLHLISYNSPLLYDRLPTPSSTPLFADIHITKDMFPYLDSTEDWAASQPQSQPAAASHPPVPLRFLPQQQQQQPHHVSIRPHPVAGGPVRTQKFPTAGQVFLKSSTGNLFKLGDRSSFTMASRRQRIASADSAVSLVHHHNLSAAPSRTPSLLSLPDLPTLACPYPSPDTHTRMLETGRQHTYTLVTPPSLSRASLDGSPLLPGDSLRLPRLAIAASEELQQEAGAPVPTTPVAWAPSICMHVPLTDYRHQPRCAEDVRQLRRLDTMLSM
ncbi:Gluconate transport-inducing protein [Sorochytrium milnesiophthora]